MPQGFKDDTHLRSNEDKTVNPIDLFNLYNIIIDRPDAARLDIGKDIFQPIDANRKCDEIGTQKNFQCQC